MLAGSSRAERPVRLPLLPTCSRPRLAESRAALTATGARVVSASATGAASAQQIATCSGFREKRCWVMKACWFCMVKLQSSTVHTKRTTGATALLPASAPRRRSVAKALGCVASGVVQQAGLRAGKLVSADRGRGHRLPEPFARVLRRHVAIQWLAVQKNGRDAPALAYRCGGSQGFAPNLAVRRAPCSRLTRTADAVRTPVAFLADDQIAGRVLPATWKCLPRSSAFLDGKPVHQRFYRASDATR